MLRKAGFCQQYLPSYYLTWTLLLTLLARFAEICETGSWSDGSQCWLQKARQTLGQWCPGSRKICCFNDVLCAPKFCLLRPGRHLWPYVALSSPSCLLQLLSMAHGSRFSLVLHTTQTPMCPSYGISHPERKCEDNLEFSTWLPSGIGMQRHHLATAGFGVYRPGGTK